jgi:hypothetical protein
MKNLFEISGHERSRILGLHEEATKRVYLPKNHFVKYIKETTNITDPSKPEDKVYNISQNFGSGQYQLADTTDIDNVIEEFKKTYGNDMGSYKIVITSSESKVPNTTVGLKSGQLSELRLKEIENYLKSKKLGVPIEKVNQGAQGPEWDRSKGSQHEDYKKYQYVLLSLVKTAKTEPTQSPTQPFVGKECLKNLVLDFDYVRGISADHNCNKATFKLYANGVPVKNVDKSKSNEIHLNNLDPNGGTSGPNRFNKFVIDEKDAEEILKKGQNIQFTVYCMYKGDFEEGCHSDPLLVSIYNPQTKNAIVQKKITIGQRLKFNEGKNIMTLDACGNIIGENLS